MSKEEWNFQSEDLIYMKSMGISEEDARHQIDIFQSPPPYIKIWRSCTLGDGIIRLKEDDFSLYLKFQEEASKEGRFIKFVPASGASSRMFDFLYKIYKQGQVPSKEEIRRRALRGDKEAKAFLTFQDGIRSFAFYDDLKSHLLLQGFQIEKLLEEDQWDKILYYLLTDFGLNYGNLPKGLLKFHRYPSGVRTAFEEHLVEAVHTICDQRGICRLHFTIPLDHEKNFHQFWEMKKTQYEKEFQVRFEISFSFQEKSTHTIAVDEENRPIRYRDGKLIFRPGGHGALLKNLDELNGDLIYIKNIDNVLPDRLKGYTIFWEKVLGGFLINSQKIINQYLRKLNHEIEDLEILEEITIFIRDKICFSIPQNFSKWRLKERKDFLFNLLNRPIRVCGMVKNEGEPGGGPFWVQERDGSLSLQIVEWAQVDHQSPEQEAIWTSSSHFNPVDIVCAVRDFEGKPFRLKDFVDRDAVIISKRSINGRDIKSLELPGLWNGGMARWITFFVEVPSITFNPVKIINDLLRPEHQP